MNNQSTHIKHVSIEGLWNRYDVDWTLHSDVNILIGENGSGKSTILALLRGALNQNFALFNKKIELKSIKIVDVDSRIISGSYNGMNEEVLMYGAVTKSGFALAGSINNNYNIDLLKTFDNTPFGDLEYYANNKPEIVTNLDRALEQNIAEYNKYQVRLSKKSSKKENKHTNIFDKLEYFKNTVSRLFTSSGKKIDDDSEDLDFLLEETNKKISAYSLSSGEKQLLIILLKTLCQDEKPFILLLDEPEISLHIDWQEELISILRTLNPNCQLIIATHSVGVFMNGWNDKIFDMLPGEHGRNPILKPTKNRDL